ncbi:MAG: nucleotidyltransferase [Saprospiraceae bacterium]|nr:nucleotidyltransferase [Saprospiraceae bacterium]
MVLNKDFKEFIELLNYHEVQYIVVGGYAVAFHGYPRYTNDIDFWILPNPTNAEKLLTVLRDFGFESLDISIKDFTHPNNVIQLGQPPYRIDLITSVSGVDFQECLSATIESTLDGVPVRFISLEDLKKNKRASGRLKDLNDIEELGG